MKPNNTRRKSIRIAPLPENLFREPIDFLIADHARIRLVCDGLECLNRGDAQHFDSSAAARCAEFLERDLVVHFHDEEEALAPRLRMAWPAADRDGLERNLQALVQQHRSDLFLSKGILPLLRQIAAGAGNPGKTLVDRATVLVVSLRRNLAWEEELILRPARPHFSKTDLEVLGRAMSARHGVAYPEFE